MQGTRERILAEIVRQRSARVEELAEDLAISTAAVRRHLDHLRADGLVEVRSVKQATGRPYHEYHPTAAALGSLPDAYARLLEDLLPMLEADDDIAASMTLERARQIAARHTAEVSGASADEAAARVTESLRAEGILEEWEQAGDGFRLVNGTCPYLQAAEISRLPCESDRQAISLLMGREVEQTTRIVDGAPICEYLVRQDGEPVRERETASEGVS